MAELILKLLVAAFLIWVFWSVMQLRYVFVVRVEGGRPRLTRGKVAASFLSQVADACERNGVQSGWVAGVRRGKHIALVFSPHFPPGCRQQIRNEWQLSS